MPELPPDHPAGFIFKPWEWGPAYWKVFHTVTFLYPLKDPLPEHKILIRHLFSMLPHALPCGVCSHHLIQHYQANPLTDEVLESRDTLSRWFVDIHNAADKDLGKRQMTYDEAYKYYMVDSSNSSLFPLGPSGAQITADNVGWVSAVIVLAVVVVVLAIALGLTLRALKKARDPFS